jgi:hypothetical protein
MTLHAHVECHYAECRSVLLIHYLAYSAKAYGTVKKSFSKLFPGVSRYKTNVFLRHRWRDEIKLVFVSGKRFTPIVI